MRMRQVAGMLGAMLLGAAGAMAQTTAGMTLVSPPPSPVMLGGGLVSYAGGVAMPGIKGEPYSMVSKTTTVKKLEDGTTITNVREQREMRDMEGRTRTEQGLEREGEQHFDFVTIMDPVARTSIMLNTRAKTARVTHMAEPKPPTPEQEAERAEALAKAKAAREARLAQGATQPPPRVNRNFQTEHLGQENIAGVLAEGTRTTMTVPAGTEGNDRDMHVVMERWFSPDLHVEMGSTTDDPRIGKMTKVVSELQRGSPDPENFRVPADYKVTETAAGMSSPE